MIGTEIWGSMSWIVSSPDSYVKVLTLVPQEVALFGNRVIAGIIKMWSYWRRMDPQSNTPGVLIKRGHEGMDTHTGENHMKMKAEIGLMQQKAGSTKDCQQTPRSQDGPGEKAPSQPQKEASLPTPWSQTSSHRGIISFFFSNFNFYCNTVALQCSVSFYRNSKVNLSGDLNRKEIQTRDDQFPLFNHSVCGICCNSSSRLTDGEWNWRHSSLTALQIIEGKSVSS